MLHLDIEGLGTELKLRTFDMTSNTYLREICLKCPEYMGQDMLAELSDGPHFSHFRRDSSYHVSCVLFPPYIDSEEKQVQLITTLDNTEVDLLTLEYIKVCVIPWTIDLFQIHLFRVVPNGGEWLSH